MPIEIRTETEESGGMQEFAGYIVSLENRIYELEKRLAEIEARIIDNHSHKGL